MSKKRIGESEYENNADESLSPVAGEKEAFVHAFFVYGHLYFYRVLCLQQLDQTGKVFCIQSSAIQQHYPALVYFGHYVRDRIKGFLSGGGLSFPIWDFRLGLGADVITTLH